jgi:hypothetical protein
MAMAVLHMIYTMGKTENVDIRNIMVSFNGTKLWHDADDPSCEISI